jgi:hypothetical protein
MGALFQDRLAGWPSVVTWDSDSGSEELELRVRQSVAAKKPWVEENSEGRWTVEVLREAEDVTSYVTVTVILRVKELTVVTTCEYPINRFANPNPVYQSLKHVTIVSSHLLLGLPNWDISFKQTTTSCACFPLQMKHCRDAGAVLNFLTVCQPRPQLKHRGCDNALRDQTYLSHSSREVGRRVYSNDGVVMNMAKLKKRWQKWSPCPFVHDECHTCSIVVVHKRLCRDSPRDDSLGHDTQLILLANSLFGKCIYCPVQRASLPATRGSLLKGGRPPSVRLRLE